MTPPAVIVIRVALKDKEQIDKAARAAHLPTAAWLRQLALRTARKELRASGA